MDEEYLYINSEFKNRDIICEENLSIDYHIENFYNKSVEEQSKKDGFTCCSRKNLNTSLPPLNFDFNDDSFNIVGSDIYDKSDNDVIEDLLNCNNKGYNDDNDYLSFNIPAAAESTTNSKVDLSFPSKHFDLFNEDNNDDFESPLINVTDEDVFEKNDVGNNHNNSCLSGVLGHRRTLCPNFYRMKPVAAVSSCGSILRHSASMPNTRLILNHNKNFLSVNKNKHSSVDRDSSKQNHVKLNVNKQNSEVSKSKHYEGTYPALEDHRYYARMKRPESPPPIKKRNFMNSMVHRFDISPANQHITSPIKESKMSILEKFLRARCPLDPNKGSNAALATKGMLNLCIKEQKNNSSNKVLNSKNRDDLNKNNILKKLLTGELEQSEAHELDIKKKVQRDSNKSKVIHEELTDCLSQDKSLINEFNPDIVNIFGDVDNVDGIVTPSTPISSSSSTNNLFSFNPDNILVDGFGLDTGLLVDENKGAVSIGVDPPYWQDDDFQMNSMFEFEENIRQHNRQETITLQHYTNSYL
ncbi:hypothetical protein HELRODRAFT_170181 [Helobdella robusta]|uniref:Uncharacterized protein n=1 Tax=Helobdella robusta TaxID=6412 RepID=T1F2R5_HELRO|nr:hypothetical protein HELRODRAFT_170181 [Helobdella robusta]ESO07654.1 hypothetical protein HELRODRAFT_170181 [Helobdella robusta]